AAIEKHDHRRFRRQDARRIDVERLSGSWPEGLALRYAMSAAIVGNEAVEGGERRRAGAGGERHQAGQRGLSRHHLSFTAQFHHWIDHYAFAKAQSFQANSLEERERPFSASNQGPGGISFKEMRARRALAGISLAGREETDGKIGSGVADRGRLKRPRASG